MVEFRWIIFSLFLMLLFSFTDAATGRYTVMGGDEASLSCGNMIDDQEKCGSTTWAFRDFVINDVILIDRGQIHKEAKTKSDRLSVTENCSLVIKKVTAEDAGLYVCTQFKSRSYVSLFVVTMTEQKDDDKVTLNCSVMPCGFCEHTVKWLYEGKDVNKDNEDMETSDSRCSVTVTFLTSYLKNKPNHRDLFKCELMNIYSQKLQQFNFNCQSSVEKTDDDAMTTKSPTTIKSTSTTGNKWTSVKFNQSDETNKTSTNNNNGPEPEGWWWIIIVSVGVAAHLIITVTVIRWKRTKGNKTEENENMADPEDGVSYASISYNKKTNSETRVRGRDDDDDEGDTVTYSTVKASSSSAGASNDPSSLYTAVNKPKRENVT